jgi:hypothetical protein
VSIPTSIEAREVNTGGGCMVTIIQCPEWDYILATTEESVAVFKNEDAFWENKGADALAIGWVDNYPVDEFEKPLVESRFITHRYYDNHKFFNEVLVALMPQGAVDMSSHDDEYPSVGLYIDNDKEIGVQMLISPKHHATELWRVNCFYYYGNEYTEENSLISFDFDVDECVKMFNEILERVTLRIEKDKGGEG